MEQSARDLNCAPEDFLKTEPVLASGGLGDGAKKYYRAPVPINFVSYGSNVVASAVEEYREIADAYIRKFMFYRCFETPSIHWLDERLSPLGLKVCFMAEYQLPDPDQVRALCWASALTTGTRSSGWPGVRRTRIGCGRSAWTCCPNTAGRAWRRR